MGRPFLQFSIEDSFFVGSIGYDVYLTLYCVFGLLERFLLAWGCG